MPDHALIEEIRSSSRLMVRELGFMNATLAATEYSPSAVHSLVEIENQGAMTAAQLVQILGLEKSSVSRMLARLLAAGELQEVPSENLDSAQQQAVAKGLTAYARALERCRDGDPVAPQHNIEIVTGYQPGMIGRIAEMHGTYYASNYNFGHFFEGKVASGLAEFCGRLHEPCNQVWLAVSNGRVVGSVAIDGQDLGNNEAHLRWFILDDRCRGTGMGRKLLSEAIAFCDGRGFDAVQLWTFSGLHAARRLYESFGFELLKEWQGDQWGMTMTEQQFTRRSPLHSAVTFSASVKGDFIDL